MRANSRVDALHLVELRIRNVGLGQQDVHVPRHAAGHGVDGVADVDAPGLEQIRELARDVLRLGDCKAVARDEHDAAGVGQQHRGIGGSERAHAAAARARAGSRRTAAARAEGAEEHVGEGAVHGLAHLARQQGARGADERSRDDQQVVVQDEARGRGGNARERVQQRDHNGHVGAADRQHEEHAEQQGESAGCDEP